MTKQSLPKEPHPATAHNRLKNDPHLCTGHCLSRQEKEGQGTHRVKQPPRTFPVPACPPAERQDCRIGGIILAAGRASRMGRCKAVLPLGTLDDPAGCTVLQSAVQALQGGCNGSVIIVTGFHADTVSIEATRLNVKTVHNPDADTGMFSSICAGIAALLDGSNPAPRSSAIPAPTRAPTVASIQGEAPKAKPVQPHGEDTYVPEGIFVLPVDIPLVRPTTCALLAEDFAEHRAAVTYPVFAGERGHPPLLRADVAQLALAHTGEGGLRTVLDAAESAGLPIREVETADAAMLMDMDTPQGYETVKQQWVVRHVPSEQEIHRLLQLAQTPAHVQAHGLCVAKAAVCMGHHLNEHRLPLPCSAPNTSRQPLDLALLHAAGCLHDICKGAQHHEQAGGLFLARYGFKNIGSIVAAHRDIDPVTVSYIAERELVMLADKFVRGTALVPIAERFDERLREWAHDTQAVADIDGRKARALQLCTMLEAELGMDVHTLLQRALLIRSDVCPAT